MSTFKRRDPAALQAQLQQMKGGSSYQNADDKLWKPTKDAAGNSTAVIRFLPGKGDEGLPFVKMINHYFKMNGKTYYGNCTSTHGDFDSCPVCEHISKNDLFNTKKTEYDKLKRKTQFWANILVLKDTNAPENENKVFKFRFGVKIMEKITATSIVDESLGEQAIDITCPFGGANFIVKVKKQGEFDNYDDSKFAAPSEIPNINDAAFQAKLEEEMSDLNEIVSKDKFDSYDKNKEKLNKVLGTTAIAGAGKAAAQADALGGQLDNFDAQMAQFEGTKQQTTDQLQDDLDSVMSSPTPTAGQDEFADLLAEL